MTEPLSGRLLVATPLIADGTFDRTVVAVLEHGEGGALGLVLNRPSTTAVLDPLPGWDRLAAHPAVVFVGGPVEQQRAIALARHRPGEEVDPALGERFESVIGDVGTLDLAIDPDAVGGAIEAVRVFSGYAGWGPDQLEGELAGGAWWVVDGQPDDVLCERPEQLWRSVLGRQEGDLARFAALPRRPLDQLSRPVACEAWPTRPASW